MYFKINSRATISGSYCKFKNKDFTFTFRKGKKNEESVSANEKNITDHPVRFFTKLLGTLTSTIQAILSAPLQFQYLQQQQILTLKKSLSYMTKVTLNPLTKEELAWRINNLKLSKDRYTIQSSELHCAKK